MRYDIKALDVLFRCMSPDLLWRRLNNHQFTAHYFDEKESRELFKRFAVTRLLEFSLDEHGNIFEYIWQQAAQFVEQERICENNGATRCLSAVALYTVLRFADEMLTQRNQEPRCRIDYVQTWRDAFLLLGQDLFVCAFMALEDNRERRDTWDWGKRLDFSWPAVLRTDHCGLNELLKEGLHENHQHLYGSSQTFAVSWCNLMNDPKSHAKVDKRFSRRFQPFAVTGANEQIMSPRECVRIACILRKRLFCWIKGETDIYDDITSLIQDRRLAQDLVALRYAYGARVPQHDHSAACLDYALEEHVFQASKASNYRVLAGERNLLYACFQRFLSGKMDEKMQLTLYLYILLKLQFRSELIQVNGYRGFRNFSEYQDRKTLLCDKPCYIAELIRMAINAPIQEGHVHSLETRITPKNTPRAYVKTINQIDNLTDEISDGTIQFSQSPRFDRNAFFYVIHFIKRPDELPNGNQGKPRLLDPNCRHAKKRQEVRKQAIALFDALHSVPDLRGRIRGIDSASHEIGCPPEVFAVAFRFLRKYIQPNTHERLLLNQTETRLNLTYHAGEDFLDIAGALRTIDESVRFLELRRGDRIGHALGLGIDPKAHYESKGNQIFMTKQDRLDDLVWLLYRATALGAHIDHQMLRDMETKAWGLFREIYGESVLRNNWHVGLQEYYYSMELRADDPALYRSLTPDGCNTRRIQDPFDAYYDQSKRSPGLEQYRKSEDIFGLCHLYHYGWKEKKEGIKPFREDIDQNYIDMIRDVQDALQAEIAKKGIIIECNPSSNVLIGTFLDYSKHPIIRFNNTGLERDLDRYNVCRQLQACINTDDLGVFDTSLEFEYALLFYALRNMHLPGGKQYAEADIMDYLNRIRLTGKRAVFPPSHCQKRLL